MSLLLLLILIGYANSIYWENYTFDDQSYPKGARPNGWHIEGGFLQIGDKKIKSTFSFDLLSEADIYFDWKSDFAGNDSYSTFTFMGPDNIRDVCINKSGLDKKHYHLNPGELNWQIFSGNGGHGYIDNLFIEYASNEPNPFRFLGESYSPQEGISSYTAARSLPYDREKFKYNISLETNLTFCQVTLFTISPGVEKRHSVPQGTRIFTGHNPLTWDGVSINCTSCGQSFYYFNVTYQGKFWESNVYGGPSIIACILGENHSNSIFKDKYNYNYLIKIISNKDLNIYLSCLNKSGLLNHYDSPRKHNSSDFEETHIWNLILNESQLMKMKEDDANGGFKYEIEKM